MGNCLVTKLKGVVDNSNLKKIGCFYGTVLSTESPNDDTNHVTFNSVSGSINVKVISGNLVLSGTPFSDYNNPTGGVTEITLPQGFNDLYYSNAEGVVEISNKYNISIIHATYSSIKLHLDDMTYMPIREVRSITGVLDGKVDSMSTWIAPSDGILINVSNSIYDGNIFDAVKNLKLDTLCVAGCTIGSEKDYTKAIINSTDTLKGLIMNDSGVEGNIDFLLIDNQLRFPLFNDLDIRNTPNLIKNQETIDRLIGLGVSVTY